jgi:predicted DNA-binding transcriptional regulator AlpA
MSPRTLAGVTDVAEILDVPRRTAARYVDRDDFPKPVDHLPAGRVWRRADVERWGRERLPLPTGRPRKSAAE